MKKNALVILVLNMLYFNIMLKNMPKQTNSDLIIVTDIRMKDIVADIKKCLNMHNIEAKVVTSESIVSYSIKNLNLTDEGKEFLRNYTMGLNILTQFYLLNHPSSPYEKILFLDDDVLINKDVGPIFDKYKYAFVKSGLGYKFRNSEYDERLLAYFGAGVRTWVTSVFNSGQRLYHKDIIPVYKWMLELFFNEYEFQLAWNNWKNGLDGWKTKAFFMDQNFENCVVFNAKVMRYDLNKHARVMNSIKGLPKNLSILLNRELLHYAIGTREKKIEFLKLLKREGLIK